MLINIVLKDCIYIECAVLNIIRKQSPRECIMCVLLWILTSPLQTSKNEKNSRKISKKKHSGSVFIDLGDRSFSKFLEMSYMFSEDITW